MEQTLDSISCKSKFIGDVIKPHDIGGGNSFLKI